MLEALATGLPVVCTDVSGAHECVREPQTGLVVPVGDSTALADAIVELANDPAKRTEMSKRAVALIRNRYSIEHVAELHEQLYQSLIGDRRTGKGP
jgi:glycosyltransferase involved in cell wall biosynthesis